MSSIDPRIDSLPGLQAFAAVAEAGSFAAAARRAGQAPSTIAKAVARLEADLGVTLFRRTTRSVTLTDDGALLLGHAERIIEELTLAESALSGRTAAPTGRLKLSLPVAFGESLFVPALPGFLARYPDLSVETHLEDRVAALVEEGYDAAVRIAPRLVDSTLMARHLGAHRVLAEDADLEAVRTALLAARTDTAPEVDPRHAQPGRKPAASPWGEVIARTFRTVR